MPLGLSDRAAGQIVGVSHTAIRKARERGHLRTMADGSVDPGGIEEWQTGRRAARGGRPPQSSAVMDIPVDGPAAANARAAIAIIEAEGVFTSRNDAERYRDSFIARLKQIEYDLKSASVVEIAAVTKVLGEQLSRVRTRLLALPAEQAPKLHRCKTVAELQDLMLDMITRILEELSADGARPV